MVMAAESEISQVEVQPPASEDAEQPDVSPVEVVPDEAPATEAPEEAEWEPTDDELEALIDLAGDKLTNNPRLQSIIDQKAAERAEKIRAEVIPQQDEDLIAARNDVTSGVQSVEAMIRALNDGEVVDAEKATRDIVRMTRGMVDASHRELFHTVEKTFRDLGVPLDQLDDYAEMKTAYRRLWSNPDNPRNRQAATQAFVEKAITFGLELGIAYGESQGSAKAAKGFEAKQKLAQSAMRKEMLARAAAKASGAPAPPDSGGNAPARTGPLTIEEAQTLPIEELKRRSAQ